MVNKDTKTNIENGSVEFLDPTYSNASEQNRVEWTTQLAAISRGKDKSANPSKRYMALQKEAEGNKPSRPFEFLPVVFESNQMDTLFGIGIEPDDAEEKDYWLPPDLGDRILDAKNADVVRGMTLDFIGDVSEPDSFIEWMIDYAPQSKVQALLRALGYRREIYSRAPYYFKMKQFVITGWVDEDVSWPHFLRERNAYMDDGGPKNWTQSETQKYAFAIRKLLEVYRGLSKKSVLGITNEKI